MSVNVIEFCSLLGLIVQKNVRPAGVSAQCLRTLHQAHIYAKAFEFAAKSFPGGIAKAFKIVLDVQEGV